MACHTTRKSSSQNAAHRKAIAGQPLQKHALAARDVRLWSEIDVRGGVYMNPAELLPDDGWLVGRDGALRHTTAGMLLCVQTGSSWLRFDVMDSMRVFVHWCFGNTLNVLPSHRTAQIRIY